MAVIIGRLAGDTERKGEGIGGPAVVRGNRIER
jgi:hypothetical protein